MGIGIQNDRRCDIPFLFKHLAAAHHLAARRGQQLSDTSRMRGIDHPRIIHRKARIVPPLPLDGPLQLLHEPVANRLVDKQEIGCHAGLAGIERLPPHDAPRRQLQIGLYTHDTRAFPAQFERDGRQMPGCTGHDLTAEGSASGIENMVEALCQQLLHHLRCVGHQRRLLLRKTLADDLRQHRRRRRSARRRFQYHTVPRSQRSDERQQRQLQRIIPRRNDEHHTQRLIADAAPRRPCKKRGRDTPEPHPAFQVVQREADFTQHDADFGHITLDGRLTQIGTQGIAQGLLMPPYRRLQVLKRLTPRRNAARGTRLEISPLSGNQFLNIHLNKRLQGYGCSRPIGCRRNSLRIRPAAKVRTNANERRQSPVASRKNYRKKGATLLLRLVDLA